MSAPLTQSPSLLVPLLERIYETGEVETGEGERRPAVPVSVPRGHAVRLATLVQEHELHDTLETGMAYGLSTLAIAGAHAARGRGHHIAIDPNETRYYEGIGLANLRRAGLQDRVRFIPRSSQEALPRLADEGTRLDFALIDGSHLFDHALVDFFYVDQMLTPGGLVAFHDVWMPAVHDVVDFVLANRNYEEGPASGGGMAVLRKRGRDRRPWDHYRPFASPWREARSNEEQARELFDRLLAGAEEAADRAGGFRERYLTLGGSAVRMRFAGLALEPAMLPAFAHASAPASGAPELEILLWDSDSTGVRGPRPPWGRGDVRARGDVCGYEDPEVSVVSDHGSGGITVFHRGRAMIVYWVADSRVIPWYESAAPLRAALHHWAAGANRHLVHAGAVGSGGAGVLVAGPSGSGKSTTALASLEAGLEYAGDDYVILDPGHPPVAHCLYSTAKLDAAALARLPGLAAAVSDFRRGEETKAVLSLHAYRPDLLRRSLRVDAIVLPTIGRDGGPGLRPATAAATLRALAPSSLLQLPGAGQAGMSTMAGLVRRVPAFHLELGPEIAAVPKLVAEVCAEAARNRVSAPAQDQG